MCSWKGISYGLAGCLLVAFSSAADESSLERQKRLVVEGALIGLDDTIDTAAIIYAARGAHAIEQVEYDGAANVLSIRVAGTPAVHWNFMKETNRLAIDVYDAVNLVAGKKIEIDAGGLVESIRTSLFKLDPKFVSRVVLQLAGPVTVSLDDSEPGLLQFTLDVGTADAGAAAGSTPEPSSDWNVDALVASIEAELDGRLARPDADRERLVALFAQTREEIAVRHETLKADAETKSYPVQLGYLVLLADHEALLGDHLGEITGEHRLIAERVDTVRSEMETILKSDFEEQALRDVLNSLLAANREERQLDVGRFEQILAIASDEQQVAVGAIENLALKIAEAPSVDEPLVDEAPIVVADAVPADTETVAENLTPPVLENSEAEMIFVVTDAEVTDDP